MYKKSIALLAIIMTSVCLYADYPATGGYPADQGYQPEGHHHHKHHDRTIMPEDQRTINEIDAQLAMLNATTRDPYHKIEIAYATGTLGAIVTVVGFMDNSKDKSKTIATGIAIVGLSVGGGMLASQGDQKRLEATEKTKRDLMDRKEAILKQYRSK